MSCFLVGMLGAILSPLILLVGIGWWVSRDPEAEQNWREHIG